MLVPRTQKAGNDISFWTSSLEGGAVPQEQGSEIPSWAGWLNNTVGAGAYDATVIGGSMSSKHYASAWTEGGKARITTYNLTKIGKGIGYCTSFLGVGIGVVTFAVSGGVVTVIGFNNKWLYGSHRLGIGFIDAAGGFNGFYSYLDNQQQFYNSTGGIMIPVNGVSSFILLRRP